VSPATPEEPPGLDDGSAAAVLDEAEDFLRSVGDAVLADVQAESAADASRRKRRWRFRRDER
jgi:hypothetical protein